MIVCLCEGISDAEIKEAIGEGARSLQDLQKNCKAGTGCGGCHEQLSELLRQEKTLDKASSCDIAICEIGEY